MCSDLINTVPRREGGGIVLSATFVEVKSAFDICMNYILFHK